MAAVTLFRCVFFIWVCFGGGGVVFVRVDSVWLRVVL